MILNETNATRRRCGPLKAIDADGNNILGGAGIVVETTINGSAPGTPAGTLVEIGEGYYYYQAAASDATALGWIVVTLGGTARFTSWRENVERYSGGIAAGTVDAALLRCGPLYCVDMSGNPLTGAFTGTVETTLTGAAFGAPAGVVVEAGSGSGLYFYQATAVEAASVGWVGVKLSGTCMEVFWREDIVQPGGVISAPIMSNIAPAPGAAGGDSFSLTFETARITPITFDLTNIPLGAGISIIVKFPDRNETYEALDAEGNWLWPFDVVGPSDNMIGDLASEPVAVQMIPRGGWRKAGAIITVQAAVEATVE